MLSFCFVLFFATTKIILFEFFVEVNPFPIFPFVTAVVNFQLGFTNQFRFKLNIYKDEEDWIESNAGYKVDTISSEKSFVVVLGVRLLILLLTG